jgi:RND family efflux transporter MFP subunit
VKRGLWLAILFFVALGVIVYRGISGRTATAAAVQQETVRLAVPTVTVIHPKPGALQDEIVLPGNVQAFTDSPIYARASGYLKKWYVDIGAHVKAGQLLAEIDAPEIDQQVQQARAALEQAKAAQEQASANYEQGKSNAEIARVTAQRWSSLVGKGAVSKQENDQYQAQSEALAANLRALEKAIAAARSSVAAAEADLARVTDLQNYKLVKAPFDGVITARNTDVGALINAGNGGLSQELFHLAANSPLRVYIDVPEINSRAAAPGVTAYLTLAE